MSIESDKLVIARLSDAVKMTDIKNIPSFLGFLNEREFSVCKSTLDKQRIKYAFFGGYADALRVFIAVLPDWADEVQFPFSCLKISFKSQYSLSHRDFLGAFMALGIEREKLGDILVKEGEAYVFVSNSIEQYCIQNISKIGSVGVDVSVFEGQIHVEQSFEEILKTIASDRADCVVAALCNLSREKAKDFILSGNLIVNHVICESVTMKIKSSDVLSVRGKGKFIVSAIEDKTKKGRLKLNLKKYI